MAARPPSAGRQAQPKAVIRPFPRGGFAVCAFGIWKTSIGYRWLEYTNCFELYHIFCALSAPSGQKCSVWINIFARFQALRNCYQAICLTKMERTMSSACIAAAADRSILSRLHSARGKTLPGHVSRERFACFDERGGNTEQCGLFQRIMPAYSPRS